MAKDGFDGNWQATSLGGMWSIDDPDPADVEIEDIAAGLSRACRYAGQLREDAEFYAVSEHSVLMTAWAWEAGLIETREEALAYLLHDASEAFFGDMPSPMKKMIPQFKAMENRAQTAIHAAFGLDPETVSRLKPEIKTVDIRIRMDEREALILEPALSAGRDALWADTPDATPLGVELQMLEPRAARIQFRDAFLWCLELPSEMELPDAVAAGADRLRESGNVPHLPATWVAEEVDHVP